MVLNLPLHLSSALRQTLPPTASVYELRFDSEQQTEGVPSLYLDLMIDLLKSLNVMLRIHNRAGIPIIVGPGMLEVGQHLVCFDSLQVLGIEAYAHVSQTERIQIAQRIWDRRTYATLDF